MLDLNEHFSRCYGGYRLQRRINTHGQAKGGVWWAVSDQLRTWADAAVKIYRRADSRDDDNEQVLDEILALGATGGGVLPRLLEVDRRPIEIAVVMEYCHGQNLNELLADQPGLQPLRQLEIMSQIAFGLACLHNAGWCHGDLKPSNVRVLVPQDDTAALRVRVIDLGSVCRVLQVRRVGEDREGSTTTRDRVRPSTPEYWSPEHLENELVHGSDMFQLGIVWWELLSGDRCWYPEEVITGFRKLQQRNWQQLGDRDRASSIAELQQRAMSWAETQERNGTEPPMFDRRRLERFDFPEGIKELMSECFHAVPDRRPSALELAWKLKECLQDFAAERDLPH